MKPAATYPDPEREVVDYLSPLLTSDCTVGVGVPEGHTPTSAPHLQVSCDGQQITHPIFASALVRLTVWAPSTSEAKRLCALAQGLLLSTQEWPTTPVSGPIPARDPNTRTELATASSRVSFRSVPIT